jgi:uncharacterized protein (TIGR02453 family)
VPVTFTGIPHAAVDFYAELEQDNTTEFWAAHRGRWERDVRAPMAALAAELEEEFGPAKVFRPQRNLRFSRDKTPYKTHQGVYVGTGPRTGWYAEVSADGFRLGGGSYHLEPEALAAYRAAVDGPRGAGLQRILDGLRAAGWQVGGSTLRTAPRGWPRDHPRIELLRHTSVSALRWIEDADVVTTPALVERVRADWRQVRPLVEWLRPVLPT